MQPTLKIITATLNPTDSPVKTLDMSGRCGFAICTKGEFVIKLLNEHYTVSEHSLFACMPFVNIKVMDVIEPSEVIFGQILLKDVPMMINRWVNTDNLNSIQNHPIVKITETSARGVMTAVNEYMRECAESKQNSYPNVCTLQRDIIDLQSKLLVAQVLKTYFTNIPMDIRGHTRQDSIFQQFMIDLYTNCHEQREVQFYAGRSGVSLKYFSTIIRQLSGTSPLKWIETVVVGEAKSMLQEIDRSIKDIATTLNFPDAPTFTKYFRRVTGMTPKSYRRTLL